MPQQFTDSCRQLWSLTVSQAAHPVSSVSLTRKMNGKFQLPTLMDFTVAYQSKAIQNKMPSIMAEAVHLARILSAVELTENWRPQFQSNFYNNYN